MNKKRCPICGATQTVKNGVRNGHQLYRCKACNYQFSSRSSVTSRDIWNAYQVEKCTINEIAARYGISESTVKRRLREVNTNNELSELSGSGFVHIDATYWGRGWGIILAIDSSTGMPLYYDFIRNESIADYERAIVSIVDRGYTIKGIIVDGKRGLFQSFAEYPIQMCQFHMKKIIDRYITLRPRMRSSRELKDIISKMSNCTEEKFTRLFNEWEKKWHSTIYRQSVSKVTGKKHYTHKRLRTAVSSIHFYLRYLFTYQHNRCLEMPNTNNKIEGAFSDLKRSLNNHSGLSKKNRKQYIREYMDRLSKKHHM